MTYIIVKLIYQSKRNIAISNTLIGVFKDVVEADKSRSVTNRLSLKHREVVSSTAANTATALPSKYIILNIK